MIYNGENVILFALMSHYTLVKVYVSFRETAMNQAKLTDALTAIKISKLLCRESVHYGCGFGHFSACFNICLNLNWECWLSYIF